MKRKKNRTVFVLFAALVSAALLGGCGNNAGEVQPASGATAGATTVGINVCTGCHTVATADWLTSKHANAVDGLDSAGSPTLGGNYTPGACGQCHDPNGDSANIIAAGYIGSVPRPIIGCEACHGGGSLHNGSGPISLLSNTTGTTLSGGVTVSGQFVMCTNCHELLDSTGTTTNSNPAHLAAPSPTGTQYTITDTHFATPGVWNGPPNGRTNTVDITGYAMDFANETVCTDCHNPHKAADISKEWASSKHADTYFADAWAHYNWSQTSMKACQRCHTTTGFAYYAETLAAGNQALADSIRAGTAVSQITPTTGFKPEMLECWGCHSDNRGDLRNPGDYLATYVIGTVPNASASYQYPNVAASNVCMTCHTGRDSGKAINQLNTGQTATVDFGNYGYSNVDGHYLTAGGTMFKGTGYEFAGRSYVNPASFRHYQIGTSAAPNTGTNGPCIGCHMERPGLPGNHLFEPVEDSGGTITNVSSEICFNCHAGSSTSLAAIVNQEKSNYEDALSALTYELNAQNFFFIPKYPSGLGAFPYFFTSAPPLTEPQTTCAQNVPVMNFQTGGTTPAGNCTGTPPSCKCVGNDDGTVGTGKNNIGAAFNMSLLHHEPGAFVHNSRYVKRLIYDSIDWMDDGALNYSVGTTLCSVCALSCTGSGLDSQPWCPGAIPYLLPSGVHYGVDAERP
jgi:hypothetical protein